MKKKSFMKEIAEMAERSDRERTGQSGREFEKKFDKVLGKKHEVAKKMSESHALKKAVRIYEKTKAGQTRKY